jgi:hypothetical protein
VAIFLLDNIEDRWQNNLPFLRSLLLKKSHLFRSVSLIYLASFFCYIMFTREPDFIDGDIVNAVVSKATYSVSEKQPELVVDYIAGDKHLKCSTNKWFLTRHKQGQQVRVIYDPSHPEVASIYSFTAYWIRWPEVLFTAVFFVVLFCAATFIAGRGKGEVNFL